MKKHYSDKDYTRNLHYHFGSDRDYYEPLHSMDKELLLFDMIEHWERLLMMYKGQDLDITSLEQLVDDLHIEKSVDKNHKYYKEISECIRNLHLLNSWYEEVKSEDLNESVKDDSESQTKTLNTNIPSNPFMIDGDDDLYETDELNTKQNMMFMDYLKRKGWSFSDWWKNEGEERIKEHITEIRNDGNINYKDEIGFWDEYFKENIDVLGDRLIEGCSLYRRIYIPMKVRKGEFEDLEKWEQEYFSDGITKGYWDSEGNHIGDNSNPYVKKKRITDS